ncbi:MAG: DMT family transporter [Ruminococcaceae bacterium]|nr:DMT family transporter [Oscillospiraceae bacterium]
MDRKNLRGSLILLLCALIWGCAFVAQDVGMNYVEPYTFTAARSFIGAAALLLFSTVKDAAARKRGVQPPDKAAKKLQLKAGLCAGIALFVPAAMQQIGLVYTSPGKSGFITAMYIVVVPILGMFFGKKAGLNVWISVAIAIAGLYLLCMKGQLTIERGDAITLVSVVFWAVQIMTVDYFAPRVDCVKMTCMSFAVCGTLAAVMALLTETPTWPALVQCAIPLLYAGIMSSGVAFTLQAIGQRMTAPTVAAVMMSMESVFAALAGFVLFNERFNNRELMGCLLMLAAVILAQIDFGFGKKAKNEVQA